jgi:hypothetical protein
MSENTSEKIGNLRGTVQAIKDSLQRIEAAQGATNLSLEGFVKECAVCKTEIRIAKWAAGGIWSVALIVFTVWLS